MDTLFCFFSQISQPLFYMNKGNPDLIAGEITGNQDTDSTQQNREDIFEQHVDKYNSKSGIDAIKTVAVKEKDLDYPWQSKFNKEADRDEGHWKPHQLSGEGTENGQAMNGGILGAIIPGEKSTILLLETASPTSKSISETLVDASTSEAI